MKSIVTSISTQLIANLYTLARTLGEIHDKKIWSLPGKKKYESFEACIRDISALDLDWVYRIMTLRSLYQGTIMRGDLLKERVFLKSAEIDLVCLPCKKKDFEFFKPPPKSFTPRTRRDETDHLVVQTDIQYGITVVPMYRRSINASMQRARTLRDDPWCAVRLSPDVVLEINMTTNRFGELDAALVLREPSDD